MLPCALRELLLYFLRLGTFGFGGPIALAGHMQRDLVEDRRWFSKQDYVQGLALAQLAPGPLAAQLAMYLGWVRASSLGATLVAVAFILPSFVMVLGLSTLYVHYGGLAWMQGAFYGIGAAVIAVIARSAFKLVRTTVARDWLLWTIFATNGLLTGWTEREIVWAFALSGIVALLIKAPPRWSSTPAAITLASAPPWFFQGLHGVASWPTLLKVAVYFGEAGVFVFGSGLAIVPFLRGGVVIQFHWLNDRQFLDAVAVAMITPGPVVITVAFIGFLVAGPGGALAAALGVFLPCYLFVILLAPHYRRYAENRSVKAFVNGVTAAACGAIAGAAFVLGRRAIIDLPTVAIFLAALVLLSFVKKLPEPALILAAGLAGLALKASGL
ncbi:MAG: chromate efflux transporter [Candidatus Eisenbacteria bacterium]|nr:chromate efflux transporter [Candidatus Eisenbacteria bacterium]MBI3742856.1 chromate efflux transporter [Chloroflexota bacterium]